MSYLGRAAARVAASSGEPRPARGGVARLVPSMSIESPLVHGDQRLGMPDFAGPALLRADADTSAQEEPVVPAWSGPEPLQDRGEPLARKLAPADVSLPAASPVIERPERSLQVERRVAEAKEPLPTRSATTPSRSSEGAMPSTPSQVAGRDGTPPVVEATAAGAPPGAPVPRSPFEGPSAAPPAGASTIVPGNLFAALAQVSAWISPQAESPRDEDFALADARMGSGPARMPSVAHGAAKPAGVGPARGASPLAMPDVHAPVPRAPLAALAEVKALAEPSPRPDTVSAPPGAADAGLRLEVRAPRSESRSPRAEPLPAPPAAPRGPSFDAPMIRIGKIEVEVVPPPAAPERRAPAPARRPVAPTRAPVQFGDPPPFGWRQR